MNGETGKTDMNDSPENVLCCKAALMGVACVSAGYFPNHRENRPNQSLAKFSQGKTSEPPPRQGRRLYHPGRERTEMAHTYIDHHDSARNPWEGWVGLPAYMAWLEADIAAAEDYDFHIWADADQSGDLCYFMGGETGPIKIGFARDPWSRLGRIQSGCAFPITVLAVEHGGRRRESAYHQEFNHLRVHGEWFERSPEMMQAIRDLQESMRETPLSPRPRSLTPEAAS